MTISLIMFAGVLLIAYWWSDSGAFSALLHLVCVIFAGVLSFALWEPLAYMLLGSGVGGYAMGVTLLGLFTVLLVVLRLTMDRLVPMKLSFPRAADLTIGAGFGLASGVLTIGVFSIGAGFLQSTVTVGDFSGWTRRSDEVKPPTIGTDRAPILHVTTATEKFMAYLSWGAFSPWMSNSTMATMQPSLAKTAGSLFRDSYSEGMARVSVQPSAVSGMKLLDVGEVALSAGVDAQPSPAWAVVFKIAQEGFDGGGQQFILSASQARLIGDGRSGAAQAAYPLAWIQNDKDGTPSPYYFNSVSNYATSVLSQGEGTFTLLFAKDDLKGQTPKWFELKGVRFSPGKPVAGDATVLAGGGQATLTDDPGATNIDTLVDFPDARYAIQGVSINSNDKGDLILDLNNFIIGGEQKFPKGADRSVAADLRVKGFQTTTEQRLLRLDAHAALDGVRIFPDVNPYAGTVQEAKVAVIDESGAKYFAVGLVEDDGDFVLVRSMAGKPLTLKDIPIQPLGSAKKLVLYFRVPPGTKLKGLALSSPKEERLVNTLTISTPAATAK